MMNEQEQREEQRRRRRKAEIRRKKRRLRALILAVMAAVLIGVICGLAVLVKHIVGKISAGGKPEDQTEEQKEEEESYQVKFLATGDVIFHDAIIQSGVREDGTRNYDHLYSQIQDEIAQADFAVANHETVFVDGDTFTGYPSFGSPTESGDALVKAGFDAVQHATNHAFDKGEAGVLTTVKFWQENYPLIPLLGIHDTEESALSVRIAEKNGIKIALLNYTEHLNQNTLPEEKPYLVSLWDEEHVKEDIAQAKASADVVICFLHAGEENSTEPNDSMKEKVEFLAEQGVDVTIGTHPHVLQKMETVTAENGNKMLIYYSLGNFISTQKDIKCLLGGLAEFTIQKDRDTGEISIKDCSLIPVVTHYDENNSEGNAVYKLSDYTEELAARHGVHQYTEEEFTLEALQRLADQVITESEGM